MLLGSQVSCRAPLHLCQPYPKMVWRISRPSGALFILLFMLSTLANSMFIVGSIKSVISLLNCIDEHSSFVLLSQVCPNPFVVSISCAHGGPKGLKDTLANILSGAGFTINIISEPWIEQSNVCSTDAPIEISEWPLSGLTKAPSVGSGYPSTGAYFCSSSAASFLQIHVKAPRVKESAFSMECEVVPFSKFRSKRDSLLIASTYFMIAPTNCPSERPRY